MALRDIHIPFEGMPLHAMTKAAVVLPSQMFEKGLGPPIVQHRTAPRGSGGDVLGTFWNRVFALCKYAPVSEQRPLLFPSNLGRWCCSRMGGGGGHNVHHFGLDIGRLYLRCRAAGNRIF